MDLGTAPLPGKSSEPLRTHRAGGTRAELAFPLHVDRAAREPLHRQIAAQFRAAITHGTLPPGALLPGSRALAATVRVARGVIVEAYAELHAEGYLETRHGAGTRVTPTLPHAGPRASPAPRAARWLRPERDAPSVHAPATPGVIDFRLGQPSVKELDRDAWRRAWREATRHAPPDDYGDPAGDPALRAALAEYVTRSRGLPTTLDGVLVTTGVVQALDLIARAVLRPGDTVAFENPGYRLARQVLREHGARLLPVPVDGDGLRVQDLPEGEDAPLLLYCTPSHQYPLGSRLSVARRLALLEWARRNDVLILEDDYDSEFRFDASPLPTLRSLAEDDRVAYLGTLSKVLTPAVRLGYVIAPRLLTGRLIREKSLADWHTPHPVQIALAHFVRGGHLERHVRRMRRVYARKRHVLSVALGVLAPHARLTGIDAGLHACLELPAHVNAASVAAACDARGVRVGTLDTYFDASASVPPDRSALLLGYGALTVEEIQAGAAVIVSAVRAATAPRGTAPS